MTGEDKSVSWTVYYSVRRLFQIAAWLLLKQEAVGLEHIPADGPFLLVVNHLSLLDPPIVYINVPRQLVMFSADKWRRTPGVSHIANTVGVIWVRRGQVDREALKQCLGHLKAGGALGIAPEGTRSRAGSLQEGKAGVAYIADRAGVPILPAALMGTEKFAHNLKRLRRTPVKFVVGKPFRLPSSGRAKTEELEALTDLIMCHVAALLSPEYRGVYADHPLLRELLGDE